MRWKQIRQKCYACGMPLGGFHTQLGLHTAAGADAVAGGGEYDDDHGDDDGGHSATIDHPGHPKA